MATWTRNAAGELVKREIVGWARHSVSIATSDAERTLHAVERRDGWKRVAACGAPCPSGFHAAVSAPGEGEPRCWACEGVVLDLLGIKAIAA